MTYKILPMCLLISLISACGGGGGSSSGNGSQSQQILEDEINRVFPFTANQPFDVTFICAVRNSVLTHYFDFNTDSTFDVYVTDDTGQDITFSGIYDYTNNQINIISASFLLPLNETTTGIAPFMGMVSAFSTPNLACSAYGHGYNDPVAINGASYACPYINVGPGSQEENVLEFVLPTGLPFNLPVPGSIFRQKDVWVSGAASAIITRGYGIYRRVGNTFYGAFANAFNDVNLLKGSFQNNDNELSIEQLEPTAGNCQIR